MEMQRLAIRKKAGKWHWRQENDIMMCGKEIPDDQIYRNEYDPDVVDCKHCLKKFRRDQGLVISRLPNGLFRVSVFDESIEAWVTVGACESRAEAELWAINVAKNRMRNR